MRVLFRRFAAWAAAGVMLSALTGAAAFEIRETAAPAPRGAGFAASAKTQAETGPDFPRLGMWWLDAYGESAERIARYDLLLNEFEWDGLEEKLDAVRSIHPSIRVFRPLSPSERALFVEDERGRRRSNPEISRLPSSFFLLEVGTKLSRSVSSKSKYLYVKDLYYPDGQMKFHVGGDIAIGGGESARVLAINKRLKRLSVKRGYVRKASAHKKGAHVATHIRFWPGSWVMNVTDACPRVRLKGFSQPVNWVEYAFWLTAKRKWPSIYKREWDNDNFVDQARLHYDGLILDRFEDNESWIKWIAEDGHVRVDLKHDNRMVPDEVLDASWRRGTDRYYQLLLGAFPGLPILRNNPLTVRFDQYNGQVFETGGWAAPSRAWWDGLFLESQWEDGYQVGCYMDWFRYGANRPLYVLLEVYEDEESPGADSGGDYENPFDDPDFTPNYQRVRFSLASALLGDGYYSYEINTNGHGSLGLMWFDEYDNAGAGKGWLGQPRGAFEALPGGVFLREYDGGLALVNPNGEPAAVTLPAGSWRRIAGRQCPSVNSGKKAGKTLTLPAYDGLLLVRDDG